MRLHIKFIGLMWFFAVIPVSVTTLLLTYSSCHQLKSDAEGYRELVMEYTTHAINEMLGNPLHELSLLGKLLPRQDLPVEERLRQARELLESSPSLNQIAVYHPQGHKILSLRVKEHAQQPPIPKHLTKSQLAQVIEMGTSYQPIQFLEGKIPFLPIVMTVRLKDAKTPFGYVWTTLDLRPLSKSLEKLYTRRTLLTMELDSVYVIDKEFRIIAHSHAQKLGHKSAEEIKKNIGTMVNNNLTWKIDFQQEGQRYLASIQILEQLVWGVVAQQSQTGLRNYLRGILTKSIVIAAICLLIALIAGLWFGYRISKPIRQIASAAGAVASGNFEVQVEVRSRDEVGELGQSFNKMAVDLQTYRQQMIEETRIRTDLGRYISSELVEGIVQNKISVQLGGEKRKITVMFADIVAFTALSERHKPEQIVAVLNELFTFFTEIIFRHGGTIDKFIGDCVMAVFGAPYDHPDDALRAVRAAEEMTRWLEVGNARWQKTLGSSLQMGIGIHTGEVIAGNIGSQKRMEYTVIGDTVNIAAHLESLARPGQILMTAATTREIKHQFNCVSLGQFPIKGHHQPFDIFALDEE